MLQFGNRVGRPHVVFTACSPSVFATRVEHVGQYRVVAEGAGVHANGFFGNFKNADALHTRRCAREVFVNGFAVDADGFKQLRAAVRHVGGHAHLGHDFGQAFANRFDIVVNGFVGRQVARQALVHGSQRFHGQVRMHRLCAITCQHGEMVHFPCTASLHHQTGTGAQTFSHQMLVNRRQRQQRGNGHLCGTQCAVTDDQNVVAALDLVYRLRAQ